MARKPETKCEGCGKIKSLSMCSGQLLCSSCAALAGAVSLRSHIVARMLIKRGDPANFLGLLAADLGQDWLMQALQPYLPEQVAISVENDTLDRIAKAVGYTGESGDGLIACVENIDAVQRGHEERHRVLCGIVGCRVDQVDPDQDLIAEIRCLVETAEARIAERDKLESLLRRAHVAMPDDEMDHEQLPERIAKLATEMDRLKSSALLPRDLVRALGWHEDQWEMAAIQTVADLDRIYAALGVEEGDEDQIDVVLDAISVLTGSFEKYKSSAERLSSELQALAAQLSDAEQRLLAQDQVFARLREILQADGLADAELPSAIESLLGGDHGLLIESATDYVASIERDALADFGLKVITGQVTVCHRDVSA